VNIERKNSSERLSFVEPVKKTRAPPPPPEKTRTPPPPPEKKAVIKGPTPPTEPPPLRVTMFAQQQQEDRPRPYGSSGNAKPTPPSFPPPDSARTTRMSFGANTRPVYEPTAKYESQPTKSKDGPLPAVGDYKDIKNTFPDPIVFGVPLAYVRKSNAIPIVVDICISYLEQYALYEEGMLRLAGSTSQTKTLKDSFDRGEMPNLNQFDIHSVGDCLKVYLRTLPQRILLLTRGIKEASEYTDKSKMIAKITEELMQIPEVNYWTLKRLFGFLHNLSQNSTTNRMTAENIAIVFHPTLQVPATVIRLMIEYPQVFSQ